jgi:hypothetical protein
MCYQSTQVDMVELLGLRDTPKPRLLVLLLLLLLLLIVVLVGMVRRKQFLQFLPGHTGFYLPCQLSTTP